MNKIIIKEDFIPEIKEILKLYNDVGWTAYTNDAENLKNSINNSLKLWSAWENDKLIALGRVVGDGYTIIYIQDILVLETYQDKGIGSKMLNVILEKYKHVRQIVLMTDESEKTINFYNKNGLVNADQYNVVSFIKIN